MCIGDGREDRLEDDLATLAAQIGKAAMPAISADTDAYRDRLAEIYDAEVEEAVRDIYQRDYMSFGFGPYAA